MGVTTVTNGPNLRPAQEECSGQMDRHESWCPPHHLRRLKSEDRALTLRLRCILRIARKSCAKISNNNHSQSMTQAEIRNTTGSAMLWHAVDCSTFRTQLSDLQFSIEKGFGVSV